MTSPRISPADAKRIINGLLEPYRYDGLGRLYALTYMLACAHPTPPGYYPALVISSDTPAAGKTVLACAIGTSVHSDTVYKYHDDAGPAMLCACIIRLHHHPCIVTTAAKIAALFNLTPGPHIRIHLTGAPGHIGILPAATTVRAALRRYWQNYEAAGSPRRLNIKPFSDKLQPFTNAFHCALHNS